MAVYIDDMHARYGRMIMCHLAADTTEELLALTAKIGVNKRWIQHAGTWKEHFDICLSKRARAIEFGAIPLTRCDFAKFVMARRCEPSSLK
jgi:Protein of unknown function (DUF4031)